MLGSWIFFQKKTFFEWNAAVTGGSDHVCHRMEDMSPTAGSPCGREERGGGGEEGAEATEKVAWVLALHGGAAQGYFSDKGSKKYKKVMVEASKRAAALLNAGLERECAVLRCDSCV